MKIVQLIKSERQKVNMRQDELAQGICSPFHFSKIESGTTLLEAYFVRKSMPF